MHVLRLSRFFKKRGVDDVSVDDLTQEVFLRIWAKRENYKSGTSDISYLMGFASIVLKEFQRQQSTCVGKDTTDLSSTAVSRDSMSPLEFTEYQEKIKMLREVFEHLPRKQREVLSWLYFEGLSIQEVVDQLDISKRTVYNTCSLALRRLRDMFEERESRAETLSRREKFKRMKAIVLL